VGGGGSFCGGRALQLFLPLSAVASLLLAKVADGSRQRRALGTTPTGAAGLPRRLETHLAAFGRSRSSELQI